VDLLTQKGILPFGIIKDGKRHRDFELRPRLVKDTLEAAREHGMESLKDDIFFSLCLTAKQLLRIGAIAPVTVDMLLEMTDTDMGAIIKAKDDLASRLESFHADAESAGEKSAAEVRQGTDTGGQETAFSPDEDKVPAENGA
jgi:hypothetical protein